MITEDYCSYEVAKLLKEKGFYTPYCCSYYFPEIKSKTPCITNRVIHKDEDKYLAPTFQMAMKWLREKHNLFIFPFPQMNTSKFWAEIYQLSDNQKWKNLYCESIDLQDYQTYEEACEAALKYSLENLI